MDQNKDNNVFPNVPGSSSGGSESSLGHDGGRRAVTPIPPQAPVYVPTSGGGGGYPPRRSFLRGFLRSLLLVVLVLSILLNIYLGLIVSTGLQEQEFLPGENPEQKIALIEFSGAIDMQTAWDFRRLIRRAQEDEKVKGVILVVNSPGGAVVPSDMASEYLKAFKKKTGKAVYAAIEQVGASGAYWLAAGADKIYAQPNAMVGSIGVLYMNFVVETALNEKLGVAPVVIKSTRSPFKDHNSPFRLPTETEKEDIREDLDRVHERFVRAVSEGRKLSMDQAWSLADGEVYDGDEAVRNQLIDKVGFVEDAIEDMISSLGLEDPKVVRYVNPPTLKDLLLAQQQGTRSLDVPQLLEKLMMSPQIWAIWEQALPKALLSSRPRG